MDRAHQHMAPHNNEHGYHFLSCLCIAGIVICLYLKCDLQAINHDVAWLLLASERMLAGGTYTLDFYEINMPLAIAAYIPATLISKYLAISPQAGIFIYFSVLAMWCATTCLTQFRENGLAARESSFLALWITATLLLSPGYDFGQKEHLITMLVVPFIMGWSFPSRHGVMNGSVVLAGMLGFLMKPYYAIIPAALLVMNVISHKRSSYSMQQVAFGIFIYLIYASCVIIQFQDWIGIANLARSLYSPYENGLSACLNADFLVVLLILVIAYSSCFAWRRESLDRLYPIMIASAMFMLSYLVQAKGWSYQLVPAKCTAFIAIGLAGVLVSRNIASRNLPLTFISIFLCCAWVISDARMLRKAELLKSPLAISLAEAKRGDSILVLTTSLFPSITIAHEMGLQWGSRFPTLWPLPYHAWLKENPATSLSAREFSSQVADDMEKYSPDYVIVDRRKSLQAMPEGYDIIAFFMLDMKFSMAMRKYRIKASGGDYDVYKRITPGKH